MEANMEYTLFITCIFVVVLIQYFWIGPRYEISFTSWGALILSGYLVSLAFPYVFIFYKDIKVVLIILIFLCALASFGTYLFEVLIKRKKTSLADNLTLPLVTSKPVTCKPVISKPEKEVEKEIEEEALNKLITEAFQYKASCQWLKAIETFSSIQEKTKDLKLQQQINIEIASIYYQVGNGHMAMDLLYRALEISNKTNLNLKDEIEALLIRIQGSLDI